jgi:hypothetical protein
MKKNFLFVMAAAAMLASCSKDAAVSEPAGNGNENGVVDPTNPDSPVKIQLGASAIVAGVEQDKKIASRAPIDAWADTEVGIYALAKDEEATDWSMDVTNDPTMLWENVKGTITGEASTDVDITLDLQGQPGYYPNQGKHQYTFYGYHPYQETKATIQGTKATATFTITGAEDILWGEAVAPQLPGIGDDSGNQYDGYNASYFRKGEGAKTPSIGFKHKLTQLKFKAKAANTETIDQQGLKIQSIEIKDVPTSLDLVIADKTTPLDNGKISTNLAPNNANLKVGNLDEPFDLSTASNFTAVGDPIMLFSDGSETKTFTAIVTLVDANRKTSANEITLTAPGGLAYAQGSAYTIELTINSLEEIKVQANLTEWAEGGTISGEI